MVNALKIFRNGQKIGFKKGYRRGFRKAKIIGQRKQRHTHMYYRNREDYEHIQERRRNKEQGDRY